MYWMPKGETQRGSIARLSKGGDPLTPLLPARPELVPGRTIKEVGDC
jgi:hypothetical protein